MASVKDGVCDIGCSGSKIQQSFLTRDQHSRSGRHGFSDEPACAASVRKNLLSTHIPFGYDITRR
jgi:hypothetical protein